MPGEVRWTKSDRTRTGPAFGIPAYPGPQPVRPARYDQNQNRKQLCDNPLLVSAAKGHKQGIGASFIDIVSCIDQKVLRAGKAFREAHVLIRFCEREAPG